MATSCALAEPTTESQRGGRSLTSEPSIRQPTVLLVEDNPGDARLWKEVLGLWGDLVLRVVQSGEAALALVRQRRPFTDEPEVDLVILDLGLHGVSGFEVLESLKSDAATAHIPVIVFTGSSSAANVKRAYALRANSYVCKPVTHQEYEHVVRLIRHFWIDMVRLPHAS
jgi:CheY-like chemotaxis protein